MKTLEGPFAEDEEATPDSDAEGIDTADYSFEGFEVDFSERVALLPADAAGR